jgi:hypothetical protein
VQLAFKAGLVRRWLGLGLFVFGSLPLRVVLSNMFLYRLVEFKLKGKCRLLRVVMGKIGLGENGSFCG